MNGSLDGSLPFQGIWRSYLSLTSRKKNKCVCVLFGLKKILKLASKFTFQPPLVKDWVLHYHSSLNKVFSSIFKAELGQDNTENKSKQNKNTPQSLIFFFLHKCNRITYFLKIWSLLGWYLFWFPWRVQLCLRKTCGWKTFTINYFYAYHMYQEKQRKSPLWGILQMPPTLLS